MRTAADENYLKEIYTLQMEHAPVSTSALADRFGYSSATVTGMLKKLAQLHWVTYEPYQGVILTETGKVIALEVIRHHRLIETYLAQALNIPWDRVHEEADRLEHALSEYLEERIDELLGYPSFDPHGSPIPTHEGSIGPVERRSLSTLPQGALGEIIEVSDHDSRVLVYLDQLNLRPKTTFEVILVEPIDGLVTIRAHGELHTLGQTTASHIFVRVLSGPENQA
jgi:DtxR family transcriptional regulator, Mn-dependent transcriptional regulator